MIEATHLTSISYFIVKSSQWLLDLQEDNFIFCFLSVTRDFGETF